MARLLLSVMMALLATITVSAQSKSPYQLISTSPDHKILKELVDECDLEDAFGSTSWKTTLVLPTDKAFISFFKQIETNVRVSTKNPKYVYNAKVMLKEPKIKLLALVNYHCFSGVYAKAQLTKGLKLVSLSAGASVDVDIKGSTITLVDYFKRRIAVSSTVTAGSSICYITPSVLAPASWSSIKVSGAGKAVAGIGKIELNTGVSIALRAAARLPSSFRRAAIIAVFKNYDVDGDGKIAYAALGINKAQLNLVDGDKDGSITIDELVIIADNLA